MNLKKEKMKKKLDLLGRRRGRAPPRLPPPTRLRSASLGRRPTARRLRASRRPRRRPAAPRRRPRWDPLLPSWPHRDASGAEEWGEDREREEGKGGREREIQMWERDSEGGALGPHVMVMKKIDRSLQNLRLSVKSSLGRGRTADQSHVDFALL